MIKVELETKLGKFIFETMDSKIVKKINKMKSFKFIDQKGKQITLFEDILKVSLVKVI